MERLVVNEKLDELLKALPETNQFHSRGSRLYKLLNRIALTEIDGIYQQSDVFRLGEFGRIEIPFISFGAVNTKDLFGLDELIIFAYYWQMRNRYATVLDLGANIGLHTVIMSRCFGRVISFEPDGYHFNILSDVIRKNGCQNVQVYQHAVSDIEGNLEFTRVKGNTTGSHITGSKKMVYGETETFQVSCKTLETIIHCHQPDFIKMDIEGQEKNVLTSVAPAFLKNIDMMIEVSDETSANALFRHFYDTGIHLFSQKLNWKRVVKVEDMPFSYKEGSLFLSSKDVMIWQ